MAAFSELTNSWTAYTKVEKARLIVCLILILKFWFKLEISFLNLILKQKILFLNAKLLPLKVKIFGLIVKF